MTKRIVLPFPVSVNNIYKPQRYGGGARIVLTKEARAYRERVIGMLKHVGRPLEGRLSIRIKLVPPAAWASHEKRYGFDIANYEKLMVDAMQDAGVMQNDNQIDEQYIVRGNPDGQGRAEIEIGLHEVLNESA